MCTINGIFWLASVFGGRIRYPYNSVPSSALNSKNCGATGSYAAMLRASQIFRQGPQTVHNEMRGGVSVSECVSTNCLPSSEKLAELFPSSAETTCIPDPSSF